MNGYPTDFGMTECIKLCASNKYNDKRVAYLGLMILVDETAEVLMLMTHCLQQDLHNDDMHIVSLALNVLGDIASVEMVRDLLPDIERHLLSTNPYIRKKASLAAVRAVRKLTAEETSNILRDVPVLFDLRSSAVRISGTALVNALCEQSPENRRVLQPTVAPVLINILREHLLSKTNHSGEPIIGGVRNPFLQVKLLSTLRTLLEGQAPQNLLEDASDVLAQIAANTKDSKVAGCAVLYECVRTIMSLNVDSSLHGLCSSILGKFLSHKEPTVRYIALQELTRVIDIDGPSLLQKIADHKEKVIAALREMDPTVRKRAVELIYRIANESNVVEIVQELWGHIEKSSSVDLKQDACRKTFMLLDRFGPSDEWKVETFVKTLSYADMAMPEELNSSFIAMVSSKPPIQSHAVLTLFREALVRKQGETDNIENSDPFNPGRMVVVDAPNQSTENNVVSNIRKPRLERVALYLLGEYGESAIQAGLEVPQVLDAFERMLIASENLDEPWMNTYESGFREENRVLGEIALSGLVKFAHRAIVGSSGLAVAAAEPPLAITAGKSDSADPLGAILAIAPPPPKDTEVQDGLGTDILASMGLGNKNETGLGNGSSRALVPSFNSLTVRDNVDQLMSLQSADDGGSGNPIVNRIRQILLLRARDSELETQQRACEYLMLLNESLLPQLTTTMSPMPPLDYKKIQEKARKRQSLQSSKGATAASMGQEGTLFDLLGDSTGDGQEPLALPSTNDDLLALPAPAPSGTDEQLTLEELLGGVAEKSSGPSITPAAMGINDSDLLGSSSLSQHPPEPGHADFLQSSPTDNFSAPDRSLLTTTIHETESITVVANFFRDDPDQVGALRVELLFTNKSSSMMRNFVFQLSVPKYITLNMQPPSSTEIQAGENATQTVYLTNSLQGQRPVQLRYRVQYVDEPTGEAVQEQGVAKGLATL
eukprot:GFKZ01003847.1.p1 GENE.GFKZ01003847.1~~GFKZ01003847.1.p1  ORF type:complete len:1073 (-),score=155.91 GFKZ01003847.1:2843-5671(-)